jgi:hypothetical protein
MDSTGGVFGPRQTTTAILHSPSFIYTFLALHQQPLHSTFRFEHLRNCNNYPQYLIIQYGSHRRSKRKEEAEAKEPKN